MADRWGNYDLHNLVPATPGFVPVGHPIGPPRRGGGLLYWAAVVAWRAGHRAPLRMPQVWEGDYA